MNKVIDKGFRSCRFVSTIVKYPLLLSSSVHSKRTAVMLLQVLIGCSGEKRCKKKKNAKGCFGSHYRNRSATSNSLKRWRTRF